jgi:hypothetical protein
MDETGSFFMGTAELSGGTGKAGIPAGLRFPHRKKARRPDFDMSSRPLNPAARNRKRPIASRKARFWRF